MSKQFRARILKKEYKVNGYFYNVELNNRKILPMRNILEIRNKKDTSIKIDAIVIMMNPGSSKPVNKKNIMSFTQSNVCKELERIFSDGDLATTLYETKPDRTQYQIMRVMKRQKWNCVRVINLSDIREPKSPELIKKLRGELQDFNEHSIFSTEREQELEILMGNDRNIPVILAWGVNEKLIMLARQCIEHVSNMNIVGYKKITKEYLYYHPLQRSSKKNKEWVDNICEQIKEIT